MSTGALERIIRRGREQATGPAEPCELCRAGIGAAHRHMLDTDKGEVLCVCTACTVLFNREAASEGHYRLIPDRRVRLRGVEPRLLGVPVGLAFFVIGADGTVFANYPSPAGATQWDIDRTGWTQVVSSCPELQTMAEQVEALLVDTTMDGDGRARREAWLVPIDDCFRLVAVVRKEWKGLSGGDRVRPAIDQFFQDLRRSHGQDPRR